MNMIYERFSTIIKSYVIQIYNQSAKSGCLHVKLEALAHPTLGRPALTHEAVGGQTWMGKTTADVVNSINHPQIFNINGW